MPDDAKPLIPRSWGELEPRRRVAVVGIGLVELVLTTIALRDLARRPRERVRGPKALWGLVTLVQPLGPPAYLLLGRRR